VTKAATAVGEARTVPLSAIHVEEEFNPRGDAAHAAIDELADSMRRDGVLVPLLVAPNGDGEYRLVAGERRYRATRRARIKEVPVFVRETDDKSGGLALALVENIAREQLNPVEEAKGFRRLMDEEGLTRKGVAERLSIAQKRVTERLQILELPQELHTRIASGEIPPGSIKALVGLAGIHPRLAVVAVDEVGREVGEFGYEAPTTWSDVNEDPLSVVLGERDDEPALPDEVFITGGLYPVECFSLSEKATADLAKYAELTGTEPEQFAVRFDRDAVEQANALGVYHATKTGFAGIVVGKDVADQLAGDYIARVLKAERAHRRRLKREEREDTRHSDERGGQDGAVSEEQKRQRREERKAQEEAKRAATAYNHELGAACVKHLSRIRVDERVVKILASVDLHGEVGKIALRGARYGFPGWTREVEQKNGRTTVEYHDLSAATGAAQSYLAGATSAAEVAGRALALIAMARYAREEAVAQSNRAFYSMEVRGGYGGGLPWSPDVIDLVDDICAERLPDELTKDMREARREDRERRQRVADALQRVETLDATKRAELVAEVETRLGKDHVYRAWELHQRVRELDEAEAETSEPIPEQEREAA
jgi:ParB/RepB/Spo0J family partition protein